MNPSVPLGGEEPADRDAAGDGEILEMLLAMSGKEQALFARIFDGMGHVWASHATVEGQRREIERVLHRDSELRDSFLMLAEGKVFGREAG
jgi:predicted Zn-dependent protease